MSMLWDEQLIILNGAMNPENIQPLSESTQRLFDTIDPFCKGINLDEANRAIADGADVNAVDKNEHTVLSKAIRHATIYNNTTILEKIVSLLLEIGGNPHLQNNNRRSPLIMAMKKIGCGRLVDSLKKAEEK